MLIITHIILKYSKFGRYLYAIGGNSEAANAAGFQVCKIKWTAFLPTDMSATFASWLSSELTTLLGAYKDMELTVMDSKNQLETQLSNLETCVSQGYDYIILLPLEPAAEDDANVAVLLGPSGNTDSIERRRAYEAAKAAGVADKIKFFGVDGLADAALAIDNGEMDATALQDEKVMTEEGARICH
ncbi:MAG TPA: hypothetical protein VIK78_21705 [Ruminiclostridium sp.]